MKEAGDVEEVDVAHIPHDEPERDGHGVAGGPGGDGDEVEHVACPAEEEDARPAHPHDERDRFLRLIPRLNWKQKVLDPSSPRSWRRT